MEAKIQQMLRQLEDVLPQTNFSESEQSRMFARANNAKKNVLDETIKKLDNLFFIFVHIY
jgi:hypothetical protein